MRKLLLVLTVALGVVACQKDYYLEDLQEAERNIEQLQSINQALTSDLNDQIATNESQAAQLLDLQYTINDLTINIEDLEGVNEDLLSNIVALDLEITQLNDSIADLQIRLNNAIQATEVSETLVASLTAQITELEAREPEVIIEYITQVQEVIVYRGGGTTIVDRPTLEGFTIEQLQERIVILQSDMPVNTGQQFLLDLGFETSDLLTYTMGEFTVVDRGGNLFDISNADGTNRVGLSAEQIVSAISSWGWGVASDWIGITAPAGHHGSVYIPSNNVNTGYAVHIVAGSTNGGVIHIVYYDSVNDDVFNLDASNHAHSFGSQLASLQDAIDWIANNPLGN